VSNIEIFVFSPKKIIYNYYKKNVMLDLRIFKDGILTFKKYKNM